MIETNAARGSEDALERRMRPPLQKLVGPGTLIADVLDQLPAVMDHDAVRTRMAATLSDAIKKGNLNVFVRAEAANGRRTQHWLTWHEVPAVLLTTRLRLCEDEDANDGRSRYAAAVDVLHGRATVDLRAARILARERPDLVPEGDRVQPPEPGGLAPVRDDEVSRFLAKLMEDGIPDPEIEAAIAKLLARRRGGAELPIRDVDAKAAAPVSLLLARVSEYAAYGILAPVIQELIVAPHATIGTSVIDAAAASGEIATAAEDATTLTASGVVGTEVSTDAAGHIDGKTTGWRRASRDEIRAALEDLNVQYKATGERPANQKERRRRIGEQLRSKSLTMDAKVFAGLDKLIFAGALPRGRPPKAKPPG